MIKKLLLPILTIVLVGCASFEAKTPTQRVFAVQADFTGVLAAAVAYESQPRCVAGQTFINGCSDQKIVDILRAAYKDAFAAIKAAQDVARTPGVSDSKITLAIATATAAVNAFTKICQEHNLL